MRRFGKTVLLLVASFALLSACAPKNVGVLTVHDASKKVKTVYIWDADGSIDMKLLRGLRYEAEAQLAAGGYTVSKDPKSTEAYVKITVDDAQSGDNGFIKARLYVIEAGTQNIIYDKTCEVGSSDGGYPISDFVRCALAEFMAGTGGNG
jgi:hypothetical protein